MSLLYASQLPGASLTNPHCIQHRHRIKGKGFPYSIPIVRSWSRCTGSQPAGDRRLPLLTTRPAVTFPAAEHHRPLAGTKLYCLVTEAHRWEQRAQGCYAALPRVGFEPATYWSQVQRYTRCATAPPDRIASLLICRIVSNTEKISWPRQAAEKRLNLENSIELHGRVADFGTLKTFL